MKVKEERDFCEFLVRAKINGYATGGEGKEKILDDGSREFLYEENEFIYKDSYFGFNPFIGREIIKKNEKIYWEMYYSGICFLDRNGAEKVYEFLKKALQKIKISRPYRGPISFLENDYFYINFFIGGIRNFHGAERIYFNEVLVYECYYRGGIL